MTWVNSLVLCLYPWRLMTVEMSGLRKGVASPKYIAIIKRRSDKCNLEGRPVVVKIHIINTSSMYTKCFCSPDWRRSHIFRNSFEKNLPWLKIYIRSPLLSTMHLKTNYTSDYYYSYFLLLFLTSQNVRTCCKIIEYYSLKMESVE